MKLINLILIALSVLLVTPFAQAQSEHFMPGTHIYQNAAGDRFEITFAQDSITFKDLQLNDVYRAESGHYTLQRQPTQTERIMGTVGRFAPISLSMKEIQNDMERQITLRAQLPFKQDAANGLVSPVVEMNVYIYASYDHPGSIGIWLDGIKAVENPNDSAAQRAFSKGINFALGLVYKYSHSATQDFLELVK